MELHTFQRKTWAVIFTAFMLVGLLSIGIYYLLGMLDMADTIQLPATIGAWFILSLIASSVVSHITTHPLIQMYKAINHLTADSSAPQPEHTLLGYKLVKTMIQDVYKLAGGQTDTATKLQSSQEFLQTILNSTSVPIIALNRNGQISYYNHAALNMMPQTTDNPIGSRLEDLIDITYAKDDLNEWLKTAQTDKISDLGIFRAVQVKMRDGKHYVSIAANYNKNESHNIETLLAFFDESEIYGQRDVDISYVSLAVHELRTPLTVLRGYIEVFEDEFADKFNEEQKAFMAKMTSSAAQLSMFVNNILNVARIDSDQMHVVPKMENWVDIVKQAAQDFALRASVRNRKILIKIPKELPEVAVDRVSIYEVLSNLVDNAIKYSHEGGEIIIAAKDVGDGTVETTVEDSGIGIPESIVHHLFQKFYRSHRTKESVGGTGLGLYLSKSIVEAHGGKIWVRSKEGEGATFGFTLPTSLATKKEKDNIIRNQHGWIKNHGVVRR